VTYDDTQQEIDRDSIMNEIVLSVERAKIKKDEPKSNKR